jgi:hypothetical protein
MTFVSGHRVGRRRHYPFPHLCPGQGCAVRRWLLKLHYRYVYEWVVKEEES